SHPRAFPAGQPAGHRQRVGLRTRPIASADHRPKLCGDNRGRAIMTRIGIIALAAAGLVAGAASAQDAALRQAVQADYEANLGALFDHFHRNPELSGLEAMTAARIATELRALGYETTTGVGGHGVVAVLRNGEGPTVMLRADMDGLPLEEASGLANASTARQVDRDGVEKPVMHACGHDVHITALVGTARQMMNRR